MLDDWGDVLGMRGSGSHSILVESALVPEHFVEHVNVLDVDVTNGTPGLRLHGNPLYAGRTLGFFYVEIVAIVVGTARAALDEYERILQARTTYLPPIVPRYEHHEFQRPFGLALALVDAAEATVIRSAEQYMEYSRREVEGGEPFTSLEDTGSTPSSRWRSAKPGRRRSSCSARRARPRRRTASGCSVTSATSRWRGRSSRRSTTGRPNGSPASGSASPGSEPRTPVRWAVH
jgi:hypothetical protein